MTVFDCLASDKAELLRLIGRLEWRDRPNDPAEHHSCCYCNAHRETWTEIRVGLSETWYRLDAGQHDTWCPWPQIKALAETICAPLSETTTR